MVWQKHFRTASANGIPTTGSGLLRRIGVKRTDFLTDAAVTVVKLSANMVPIWENMLTRIYKRTVCPTLKKRVRLIGTWY
jgi:hypothetical protein